MPWCPACAQETNLHRGACTVCGEQVVDDYDPDDDNPEYYEDDEYSGEETDRC